MMRPSLSSAVACLALAGFLAETRLELAALRGEAETTRYSHCGRLFFPHADRMQLASRLPATS